MSRRLRGIVSLLRGIADILEDTGPGHSHEIQSEEIAMPSFTGLKDNEVPIHRFGRTVVAQLSRPRSAGELSTAVGRHQNQVFSVKLSDVAEGYQSRFLEFCRTSEKKPSPSAPTESKPESEIVIEAPTFQAVMPDSEQQPEPDQFRITINDLPITVRVMQASFKDGKSVAIVSGPGGTVAVDEAAIIPDDRERFVAYCRQYHREFRAIDPGLSPEPPSKTKAVAPGLSGLRKGGSENQAQPQNPAESPGNTVP